MILEMLFVFVILAPLLHCCILRNVAGFITKLTIFYTLSPRPAKIHTLENQSAKQAGYVKDKSNLPGEDIAPKTLA